MSGSIFSNSSLAQSVTNGGKPTASKIYTFQVTLITGIATNVDLRALQNLNVLQLVQGAFFDNSQNAQTVTINVNTGMNLVIPGYSQGYFPLFIAPSAPVFSFTGSGTINITLTNFALPASVWGTTSLGNVFTSGTLKVSDAILDSIVNNGYGYVQNFLLGSVDKPYVKRIGNISTFTSLSNNTATVLIAGLPNSFVTGLHIYLSPNATLGIAGLVTCRVYFSTSNETIFQRSIWVPTAATNNSVVVLEDDNVTAFPVQQNDVVTCSLSTSLATGQFEITAWGGNTAVTN